MLSKWVEVLPLFIVRWLALRLCERMLVFREGKERVVALARPDVMVRVPEAKPCPAK